MSYKDLRTHLYTNANMAVIRFINNIETRNPYFAHTH